MLKDDTEAQHMDALKVVHVMQENDRLKRELHRREIECQRLLKRNHELKDDMREADRLNRHRREMAMARAKMGPRLRIKDAEFIGERWVPVLLLNIDHSASGCVVIPADKSGMRMAMSDPGRRRSP